jgi:hypothetical protein
MAEAHRKNSAPKTSSLPKHFQDFEDVFSEKSFEALLQPKEWDHAIELVPDGKSSNCKVYPLASGKSNVSLSHLLSPYFTYSQNYAALSKWLVKQILLRISQ